MARKKKDIEKEELTNIERLSNETKKSVIAILLIGLATVLILARFSKAGPVGDFIYVGLNMLLGWGYYLVPFIFLLVAFLFLLSHQKKFVGMTFLGAGSFIIFGLGLIDILFSGKGGFIGNIIGVLEIPFGYTASLILASSFLIASLLVTLNSSIRLRKKPKEEKEETKKEIEEIKEVQIAESSFTNETKKEKVTETERHKESVRQTQDKENYKSGPTSKESAFFKPKTINAVSGSKNYVPPPISLLKSTIEKPTSGDLRANANIIKRTLENFGIPVEMGEINIGPKVTRYTLKPAEGVKLARIVALSQDLSLALAAHPIRIEAPIPGKSLVGIEVPNKSAAIVRLGSLISYDDFANSSLLSFILGRDVSGDLILTDIEKMPHLLVAGATGSGKSVCIHSLITSLLYKNSPETLRLILIDPKRVELSIYNGIPHLITPVITDGKKTIGAFRWAIKEMERRYEVLLKAGSRDIKSYNKSNNPSLPYLLIIVDELADLMAAYGRDIENSIVRLAQMARATGIHLIVATQRPSVGVITGLIKANITSRIALQVASQVDSRTILDSAGAEKLLGGGDMLFISAEFSKPKRIQGTYISEEEIQKVAKFVKEENEELITLDENIDTASSQPNFEGFSDDDSDDVIYNEALQVVMEAQKASASLLQRRLKIGYARAARLLDIMEAKGVIGPGDGAKPREVYGANNATETLDGQEEVN